MEIRIKPISDCSVLKDFYCGIEEMDVFLHGRIQESVDNHYCRPYIVEDESGEIVAFFALSFDSMEFDSDDMEELFMGISGSLPNVTYEYEEDFKSKLHHPALEITFLAVRKSECADSQRRGIGREIVEAIAEKAVSQDLAGCEFLTVEAYYNKEYSAAGFYSKCHFTACELPAANKNTLRMYRLLYCKPLVD